MIQHTIATWQDLSWQDELKQMITDPEQLMRQLHLDPALLPAAELAAQRFPLRATQSFVSRIVPGDIDDPLLKQILPINQELVPNSDYVTDPLHESEFNPCKGIIHKYHGRILLLSASSCAINCRYCFRREFDYQANAMSKEDRLAALNYIATNTSIEEVIFSGGDPLMHSDQHFAWWLSELDKIAHVQRIRVHTRIPIVIPSRVSEPLLSLFCESRFQVVWVIHCNHAQEIDHAVAAAFKKIDLAGITLLNQSVLLKGVNDCPDILADLSKALFNHRVLPYYLHLLDKVTGAAHFDLNIDKAKAIYQDMRAVLPGYLLPKLVRESPGEIAKTPI